jgi:cobalt-zinc-cadmium efflux system protein
MMMAVAAGGLVMNLVCMAVLHEGHDHDLNQRGAYLHVVSDALGSVGALVSGALAWRFGIAWADPLASALIALLIAGASWRLLSETVSVLMETAPAHVDVDAVRDAMSAHDSVVEVHDLHVWTITSGLVCLSAHVVTRPDARDDTLAGLTQLTRERFGIDHVTIQLEPAGFPAKACAGCG